MKRKIRMGMVGGGPGAFIGDVHRMAARLDGMIELVCGAFSCANFKSFVPGRLLDDDGDVLLKFDNGAIGSLSASQIAVGEENALKIRVYGTKAAIEWNQQTPESLVIKYNDRPMQIMRRNWADG